MPHLPNVESSRCPVRTRSGSRSTRAGNPRRLSALSNENDSWGKRFCKGIFTGEWRYWITSAFARGVWGGLDIDFFFFLFSFFFSFSFKERISLFWCYLNNQSFWRESSFNVIYHYFTNFLLFVREVRRMVFLSSAIRRYRYYYITNEWVSSSDFHWTNDCVIESGSDLSSDPAKSWRGLSYHRWCSV